VAVANQLTDDVNLPGAGGGTPENLVVREAQEGKSETAQEPLSVRVRFGLKVVNIAVHFNDELRRKAAEIHNESSDGVLASKVKASPIAAELLPERILGGGRRASEFTRPDSLFV
jgi:hypothetical protein